MKTCVRVLFALVCLSISAIAQSQAGLVVAPGEPVDGVSQAEWSRAWWQWAGSFSRAESPVADRTGALCDRHQTGKVWFLAGTYGTQRTIRTCTVPRGAYIFFPLINYVVMPPLGRPLTCEAARARAAAITDDPAALVLQIDGARVESLAAHRQATIECFNMAELADPPARVFPSAANGYYVMLRPLRPGTHVLEFGGALPSMLQAVSYTLHVR